jgi:hypothetical protein
MAVSVANLIANTAVNTSVANTASFAPAANRLALVLVNSRTNITADPNAPTLSGGGMTAWTQVATVVYDTTSASRKRVTLFRALQASPGASAALTIDFGGQTQTDIQWVVDEFQGMDTGGSNGADAIVQAVTNLNAAGTTLTVTLAAFASANNATYGAFGFGGPQTGTAGSGFTFAGQETSNAQLRAFTEFRNDNDTGVDITAGATTEIGGIAVEIKAAAASTTVTPTTATLTLTTFAPTVTVLSFEQALSDESDSTYVELVSADSPSTFEVTLEEASQPGSGDGTLTIRAERLTE